MTRGSEAGIYRFGFDVVWTEMKRERNLLEIVVGRLSGSDSMMVLYRSVRNAL